MIPHFKLYKRIISLYITYLTNLLQPWTESNIVFLLISNRTSDAVNGKDKTRYLLRDIRMKFSTFTTITYEWNIIKSDMVFYGSNIKKDKVVKNFRVQ